MRKEKFIYNVHTLRYEKVELTKKDYAVKFAGYASAVLVSAFIITMLSWKLFPSQNEIMLAGNLENLHSKENDIYRMVFESEPIDDNIWNGGIGGHDMEAGLDFFDDDQSVLSELEGKLRKLKRQVALQNKSLEDINQMAIEKEKMLASIPSIKPVNPGKLARNVKVLSGFGMRIHPIQKIRKMHYGIDFTAAKGTPIVATGDGVVERVQNAKGGYGKNVTINHGYQYKTLYAHMNVMNVKVGQKVKKGEVIGEVGNTGSSTAPHCHYEVFHKGKKINPIHYCLDGLTPEEFNELVELSATANQSFD